MKKTLYVREEDEAIWEKAKNLFGDKLSPTIAQALKAAIRDKELELVPDRIVVRYNDSKANGLPTAKAFLGRWIIGPPDKPFEQTTEEGDHQWYYQVAITQKGKIVVFAWETWQHEDDNYRGNFVFRVFDSFEQACGDRDMGTAARLAYEKLGVPVEELDI